MEDMFPEVVNDPLLTEGQRKLADIQCYFSVNIPGAALELLKYPEQLNQFCDWLVWFAEKVRINPEEEAYSIG